MSILSTRHLNTSGKIFLAFYFLDHNCICCVSRLILKIWHNSFKDYKNSGCINLIKYVCLSVRPSVCLFVPPTVFLSVCWHNSVQNVNSYISINLRQSNADVIARFENSSDILIYETNTLCLLVHQIFLHWPTKTANYFK